MHINYFISIVQ